MLRAVRRESGTSCYTGRTSVVPTFTAVKGGCSGRRRWMGGWGDGCLGSLLSQIAIPLSLQPSLHLFIIYAFSVGSELGENSVTEAMRGKKWQLCDYTDSSVPHPTILCLPCSPTSVTCSDPPLLLPENLSVHDLSILKFNFHVGCQVPF